MFAANQHQVNQTAIHLNYIMVTKGAEEVFDQLERQHITAEESESLTEVLELFKRHAIVAIIERYRDLYELV